LKLRRALCLCLGLSTIACGGDDAGTYRLLPTDGGLDARLPDASNPRGPEAGSVPPDGAVVDTVRRSRIVSMAPSFVVVGDAYRYRVKSSSKASSLELDGAPSGMAVRGGYVEWTPTAEQAGSHRLTVRAVAGDSVAAQELNLKVATSTLRASGDVDAEQGGSVYSDSPQSARMLGAGVYVPPRAVSAGARMTVSELDQAPTTPNAAGRASAVRFGPEGQVFDAPARISLPLPEGATSSSTRTNVFVYQPLSGRWQRVQMLALDPANGLAMARASHFSVYAAIQSALDLDVELSQAPLESACAGGLLARAWVSSPLGEVELASLSNLPEQLRAKVSGLAPSLQDLLTTPGFAGSVRAVQVFELVERVGESDVVRDTRVAATTLYVAPSGAATITHGDALGNVIDRVSYTQPALALDDIASRLRGTATAAAFDAPPAGPLGLGARIHYLFFADDVSLDPVNTEDLGVAAVERAPLFEVNAAPKLDDGDCDGVVDGYDTSDDRLLASIEASPRAVVNLLAGDSVKLLARVVNGTPVTESWQLLAGAGATIAAGGSGERDFVASTADRYLVSYRAVVDGKTLEHVFAIDVAEPPAQNTPPSCRPTRELDVGRVGDALPLTAIASDLETPSSALRLEWGLLDGSSDTLIPSSAITPRADKAVFAALDAGNFQIGCRAYDGKLWGPVGRVKLSVVPREQNRAPSDLTLSPGAGVIKVNDTLTFHASAKDPDGDKLLFTWSIDGDPATGDSRGSESTLAFTPTKEGAYKIAVSVVDDPNAPPVITAARVLVGALPVETVDADKDGWSAGTGPLADCNDADASVHPGAVDLCGDAIDADCDGLAKRDDCDGDSWTLANGDCNDDDAEVYPRAAERCDGIDNDCNQLVDEKFELGKVCSVGIGACASQGKRACAGDQLSAQCTALPLKPSAESCDGIDNDCDGLVDEDVCVTAPPDAGAASDAGLPNDAGTGPVDGGVGSCVPGLEECDGIDNDCDGKVDDIEAKPCDTGLLGACGAGSYGCDAKGLACIPQTVGRAEICNDVDDDCNGKVDDGIICSCNPNGGEVCDNKLDDDCDGAIDAKDSDCTQSCVPASREYCYDGVDNDCDGAIDDKDTDCCAYEGPEICTDGKDNDCDMYADGQDTECQPQGVPADSCANPGTIQLGSWVTSYFDEAKSDIVSSCYDLGVDLVYGFTVKDAGDYMLSYDAPPPFAWSIQTGSCDLNKASLRELSCNATAPVPLNPGVYFLVVEGDKGGFTFKLDRVLTADANLPK
jgi:Putative metal-binding motif/PKD domain